MCVDSVCVYVYVCGWTCGYIVQCSNLLLKVFCFVLDEQELAAAETGKNCVVPWYIMTSGATKSGTENFLKENNFFGLDSKNIIIFEQNLIPCLTNDGKMILAEKHKLSRSPDGNGGLYAAVKGNAILDDMQSRGIEYIHVYGVDNGLVQVSAYSLAVCHIRACVYRSEVIPKMCTSHNGKHRTYVYVLNNVSPI